MEWIYFGEAILEEQTLDYVGFVYIIQNLVSNRKYVGKKLFRSLRKKKVKGKYKRVMVQSDWRKYFSSCKELHDDVTALGEEEFSREVLRLCKTKSELNYFELKTQIDLDVILRPKEYYNSFVGTRVNRGCLKELFL
jgi:Putative endonuclease segE, GIY-YIG domain